jgi:hypothetical protein
VKAGSARAQPCVQAHQRIDRERLLDAKPEAPVSQLWIARFDRVKRGACKLQLQRDGAPFATRCSRAWWRARGSPVHAPIVRQMARKANNPAREAGQAPSNSALLQRSAVVGRARRTQLLKPVALPSGSAARPRSPQAGGALSVSGPLTDRSLCSIQTPTRAKSRM